MSNYVNNVVPALDYIARQRSYNDYEMPQEFEKVNWNRFSATSVQAFYESTPATLLFPATNVAQDASQLHFAIPYVIACTQRGAAGATGTQTLGNPAFVGFKLFGYASLIDKVEINFGTVPMTKQVNFNAQFQCLRWLSSWSPSMLRAIGPLYGMGSELPEYEVMATSCNVYSGSTTNINILSNTTITAADASANGLVPADCPADPDGKTMAANRCFLSRCRNISNPAYYNAASGAGSIRTDCSLGRTPFILPSTSVAASTAADTGIYLSGMAIIPAYLVHDCFRALGIYSGVQIEVKLYFNSCTQVQFAAGGGAMSGNTIASYSGSRTCPVMVSTAAATAKVSAVVGGISNQGNAAAVGVVAGVFSTTGQNGIQNTAATAQSINNTGATAVEGWMPQISFTPKQDAEFKSRKRSALYFSDYTLGQVISTSDAQGSLNGPLGTVIKPRRIWALVQPADTVNTQSVPVNAGCLSSTGFLSAPGYGLRSTQISVNGVNCYQKPLDYSYQDFLTNTMRNMGGANCFASVEASQGLYSKQAWDKCRIYVYDIGQFTTPGQSSTITLDATSIANTACYIQSFFEYLMEVPITMDASTMVFGTPQAI